MKINTGCIPEIILYNYKYDKIESESERILIRRHLVECDKCLEKYQRVQSHRDDYISIGSDVLNKRLCEINKKIKRAAKSVFPKRPEKIEYGQIWMTKSDITINNKTFYTYNPRYIVILDTQISPPVQLDSNIYTQKVSVIGISTGIDFATDKDMIITEKESPTGFSFMIESRIVMMILKDFLGTFICNLTDIQKDNLMKLIRYSLHIEKTKSNIKTSAPVKNNNDPRLKFINEELNEYKYLIDCTKSIVETSILQDKNKLIEEIEPIEFQSSFPNYEELALAASTPELPEDFMKVFESKKIIFESAEGMLCIYESSTGLYLYNNLKKSKITVSDDKKNKVKLQKINLPFRWKILIDENIILIYISFIYKQLKKTVPVIIKRLKINND